MAVVVVEEEGEGHPPIQMDVGQAVQTDLVRLDSE
jgi:hypothetical protein